MAESWVDPDDGVVVEVVAFGFFGGRPRGRGVGVAGAGAGRGVSTFELVALGFFGGRPRGRGAVVVLTVVVDVDKRVEGNGVLLLLVPPRRARLSRVAVSVGLA